MSTTQPIRRRGKTDGVALAKAGGRAKGAAQNKTLQKLQKPKKGTEQKHNAEGAAAAAAAAAAPPPPPPKPSPLYFIWKSSAFVRLSFRLSVFILFAFLCVDIRLFAVRTYGRVIHEFDPWFNFRATQYYAEHGWEAFSTWFDTKSWYPLGRPVGTTVYPGMMVTAAKLHELLNWAGYEISLNDVCVFIPAIFAPISALFTMGLAYETTRSWNIAVIAFAIMAVTPAHTMRSVAGGFDNESVAVAALCSTFYFWVASLRSPKMWWLGAVAGVAYINMVAAWGAYTFVLNMIGVHAACMLLMRHFTVGLHLSYSLFYVIGTAGAIQFPIVGMQPFQSMEQLGPLVVFIVLQVFLVVHLALKTFYPNASKNFHDAAQVVVCIGGFVVCVVAAVVFLPAGFIGPLSARVRGLFVPHTRTGNPLVDSVAEHRATNPLYYIKYFHIMVIFSGIGFYRMASKVMSLKTVAPGTAAHIFTVLFFALSLYFSSKMVRLLLLLAPASSIAAAVCLESIFGWIARVSLGIPQPADKKTGNNVVESKEESDAERRRRKAEELRRGGFQQPGKPTETPSFYSEIVAPLEKEAMANSTTRFWVGIGGTFMIAQLLFFFVVHSSKMAQAMSEPQIMTRRHVDGAGMEILDDFREAYWYLRDETPEDSRVLAWWDYGYQINGIGNRTTLADGNTWNHEHIALVGRVLVSEEEHAYEIAQHLADYVLVWTTKFAGMRGDDLAKMPHMARIAASVFDDINGPGYYLEGGERPSPLMAESLLYKLHSAGIVEDVPMPTHFEEVYTSKNQMVRIWKVKDPSQESKDFCKYYRRYPPALNDVLEKKQDFQQIHGLFSN